MKNAVSSEIISRMVSQRHYLHAIPELSTRENETAAYVAGVLRSLGCRVTEGVGGTGVVGVLKRGSSDKVIALRADMDAIPITEQTGCPYASKNGTMHACGHDGHMAILLGTAALLSESEDFDGSVCFLFQPAEETTVGARAMMDAGVIEQFSISEIYGMHNVPFLDEGDIAMKPLGIMSGEDDFVIRIKGAGCHASTPHMGVDPFLCFAQIYQNLQLAISRQSSPLSPIVASFTELHTDGARNTIPTMLVASGDARYFRREDSSFVEDRIRSITEAVCRLYGAACEVEYSHECAPIINSPRLLEECRAAAEAVVGPGHVNAACDPWMASEDFSAFLADIPGCYVLVGCRTPETENVSLHSPVYDFNDNILGIGASYYVELVKRRLPKGNR